MASGSEDLEKVTKEMDKVKVTASLTEGDKKKAGPDRHCGFCLSLVPGAEVKLCSKCKRRAYCSKECQKADWTPLFDKYSKVARTEKPDFNGKIHGYGQGHKKFCNLPYGEEDLDWKVAPISGKGLGLVALRDLPYLYRIIVEGMQPLPEAGDEYHPGIDDLAEGHGEGDSKAQKKFNSNCVETEFEPQLGLRISRANHSCAANASYDVDQEFSVLILYSNREIKKGEEICFAYKPFNDLFSILIRDEGLEGNTPEEARRTLSEKWGIVCPPSCPCRDSEKFEMLESCIKIHEECKKDFREKNVLPLMDKILEFAEKLGCSASVMSRLYWRASEFAIQRQETTQMAKAFMEKSVSFNQAIYHPQNTPQLKYVESDIKYNVKWYCSEVKVFGRPFPFWMPPSVLL